MEAGATDWVQAARIGNRPSLAEHLADGAAALRRARGSWAHARRAAYREPQHDALTGLPTRGHLLSLMDDAAAVPATVVVANVDGFCAVNKRYGRPAGDRVLVTIAERLRACAQGAGVAARLAGDEFAVLIWGPGSIDAPALGERVVRALAEPIVTGSGLIRVSASAGLASGDSSSRRLLRDAGVALYRAKRRGKGQWQCFTSAMERLVVSECGLEDDLEGAVERGELRAVYQPLVDLSGGSVVGFEALARWHHPERGIVPPLEFIPAAERLGIVSGITQWMLGTALEQLARWSETSDAPLRMSINLSAHDLEREGLVGVVAHELARTGVEPGALILEVTESVLIGDTDSARHCLSELGRLGVGVAIDDFGTGHASLEYLRLLPFGILKIARSFSDGADRTTDEAALVRTVVRLAKSYDLTVVAEGVERREQRLALAAMGCELAQGYHFARPMPAGEAGGVVGRRFDGHGRVRPA